MDRRLQTARYVHGAGTDELLTKTDGAGTVLYYHTDGLGSVTKLTNANGTVVEQYQYDIYGAVTISVPNGSGGSTILFGSNQGNRFLFTGREWIASIGLYDYRNRVYSPELGRFLQPDPIGHLGDAYNIYRYCGNDPVNNFDPSGLNWGNFGSSGGYFSYNLSGSSSWLDNYSSLSSSSYNSISSTSYSSGGISWYSGFGNDLNSLLYGGNSRSSSDNNGSNGATSASSSGASDGSALSMTRNVLDIVSFIPAANVLASAGSAGISLYQGDYAAAGLAAVGIIPFGKWLTTGGKFAKCAYVVYKGYDESGKVRYVGITARNAAIRFAEHKNAINTGKELLDYRVIEGAGNLSKIQARVLEQSLIIKYGLQKEGGQLLNKINSIAEKDWWKYGL